MGMRQFMLIGLGIVVVAGIAAYGVIPIFATMERDSASAAQDERAMRSGTIVGTATHPSSGMVQEVLGENGDVVLRFEGYAGAGEADLHVYMSKDREGNDHVDLGLVPAAMSAFELPVPKKVRSSEYRYVVIWSESIGMAFNVADLGEGER